MKIAVPVVNGALAMHFGHCQEFSIFTVDEQAGAISAVESAVPPAHEPGVLPKWLHEKGVQCIIAGGMGMRAQQFFGQYNIKVIVGAPSEDARKLVTQWLNGDLTTGTNVCDH